MTHFHKITDQTFFIKYHTEYKREFGCREAALLLDRLEYWSHKSPNGFWKFFEPCNVHHRYKQGDSWEEELGLSRKVFNRAFAKMGVHYKSKADFDAQQDPFQGKLYASYYNRKTNLTHYLRNHHNVTLFLKRIWQSTKQLIKGVTASKTDTTRSHDQSAASPQNSSSRNCLSSISLARARYNTLQRITSSSAPEKQMQPETIFPDSSNTHTSALDETDKKMALQMTKLWNTITLNQHALTPNNISKLAQVLNQHFEGNIELWKGYCLKIASSKFLMGQAANTSFKASLYWVIKPEIIHRIMTNFYSCGDRAVERPDTPHTVQINQLTQDIDRIDQTLEQLKDETRSRQKRTRQEHMDALTPEQRQHLRLEFEHHQSQPQPTPQHQGFALDFQRRGWKALGAETMFFIFVQEHIRQQHQGVTQEEAIEQTLARSGLREQRAQLFEQRDTLQQVQRTRQTLFTTFSQKFRDFIFTDGERS